MIGVEQFKEAIELYQKHEELMDDFEKLFPGGFYESKFADCFWRMQDLVFKTNFNENGLDWINWWLYEKDGNSELKAYEKNETEIPTETIEDLWDLVKQYRK